MLRFGLLVFIGLALLPGCVRFDTDMEYRGTVRGIEPLQADTPLKYDVGSNGEGPLDDGRRQVGLAVHQHVFVVLYPDEKKGRTYTADDVEAYLVPSSEYFGRSNGLQEILHENRRVRGRIRMRWKSISSHRIEVDVAAADGSVAMHGVFKGRIQPKLDFVIFWWIVESFRTEFFRTREQRTSESL